MVLNWGIMFAAMVWFYGQKGGLPRKLLLGIEVVDSKTGHYMSAGQVFMREILGKMLSEISFMLGYLMAEFHKEKKALHDLVGSTKVIKRI